ncbi:MAG: FAD-dependent oxidoreductase, partial [Mycoplasmataceae bacterium]|nr:FAD-dependent oxidoreductase [Mycoplasmataceae bacterium]
NIEILYNSEVKELIGNDFLEKIKYVQNNQEKELEIKHLYPYIGFIPSNNFVKDLNIFDPSGFVITNDEMETNIPGIYAIGDIRVKKIRQIVTAASDGAILGKNLTNKIK